MPDGSALFLLHMAQVLNSHILQVSGFYIPTKIIIYILCTYFSPIMFTDWILNMRQHIAVVSMMPINEDTQCTGCYMC